MTASWLTPAGLHTDSSALPVEGRLPSLDGATGWLNSPSLARDELRGKVVLVSFWTYTCINWLRQLPYVRAWHEKYRDQGLVVIGVHTPEFTFEHDADNVRRAVKELGVEYTVALDDQYEVWQAFDNHFWPALYAADDQGRIRYHHFGEGQYRQTEMVLQQLLAEAGSDRVRSVVSPSPEGFEVAADWASLRTAETYTGWARAGAFASPGRVKPYRRTLYGLPDRLGLNEWALSGEWTVDDEFARAEAAGAGISFRFQARDVHLVMAPPGAETSVRYTVLLDGQPPGAAHGLDVETDGRGEVREPRLHQLIRQPGGIGERTVEITFAEPGVQVYAFTFG
jgi:thiol-disulfide isomerase/thioredoxin